MIPKSRLDAMTDGVYAFAMTLLVISLELPDDYSPSDSSDLLSRLAGFGDALFAYFVSFVVLGIRWINLVRHRAETEFISGTRTWAVLLGLFLVTLMPFSTMLVARLGDYWPSIWVYAANMVAAGFLSLWTSSLSAKEAGITVSPAEKIDTWVLIVAGLLSAATGLVAPDWAMAPYALNFFTPLILKLVLGRSPAG
jgi:uncharacterized membrane protein